MSLKKSSKWEEDSFRIKVKKHPQLKIKSKQKIKKILKDFSDDLDLEDEITFEERS